ncbi:MAG: sigma-70 family RNA polymerase sigma factor [Chthonomonadales bacterium]
MPDSIAASLPRIATADSPSAERFDDAYFESVVSLHYKRVYSLIYRMVQSEPDAADLTQETFVRVYKALPRLRAEGAQTAWIRRIATNLCLDYLRKRNATPPTSSIDARQSDSSNEMQTWDIPDPTGEPEKLLTTSERKSVLMKAVQSLPDEYRSVILLHHLEDLRVEEIGEMLGVPSGTIKSRLSRARKELKRKIGHYFQP